MTSRLAAWVLGVLWVSSQGGVAAAELENVTVLFVNDLRYDLFPVDSAAADEDKPVCVHEDNKDNANCVGGLARLLGALQTAVPAEGRQLWLNAGNVLGGDNFKLLKFLAAAQAVNFLQFNVSALGPELFRYGLDPSQVYLNTLTNATVVAANWAQNNNTVNSTVISVSDTCHVAVIGFMDKKQVDEMKVFGVTVEDEKKAIEREVAAIKAANTDKKLLYVALGSASVEGAHTLAAIPDIDLVIFSGGNFSATPTPEERAYLQPVEVDKKTTWVSSVNRNFRQVDSRFLIGRLNLQLDDACKMAARPEMQLVEYLKGDKIDNAELADFLVTEASKVAAVKEVVAMTKLPLLVAPDECTAGECSLGGLVADAMVAELNAVDVTLPWTESVKLAVVPGRSLHHVTNTTGAVTAEVLYELLDDDEYIYTVTLTSSQLKKMFDVSVTRPKGLKAPMHELLQVSGSLRVEFNTQSVSSIRAVSETSDSLALSLVDLSSTKHLHKIAVPSSMLFGSDSYAFLREIGDPEYHDVTVVDAIRRAVTKAGSYLSLPATGGRLVWPVDSPVSECVNTTWSAVIVTLVVVVSVVASGLIVWKIVLPRYRTRRGSATHLLP